jgi:taurine transport system permease protein
LETVKPKAPRRSLSSKLAAKEGWNFKVISLISLILFITFWELVARAGVVDPLTLPAPSAVLNRASLMLQRGTLFGHLFASIRRVLAGFSIAIAVALPLGIVLGSSRTSKAVVDPILSFLRPLPSMAWIPMSMIWFGISEQQKYFIVFMGTLAPTILYTYEATRNIDPIMVRAAKNLGASKLNVMREVVLPGALPNIISGLKVMLGIAWTCIISAELVAAREGLGFLIMWGKEVFQTDVVILGMVLISGTVIIIDLTFGSIERFLLPWREE